MGHGSTSDRRWHQWPQPTHESLTNRVHTLTQELDNNKNKLAIIADQATKWQSEALQLQSERDTLINDITMLQRTCRDLAARLAAKERRHPHFWNPNPPLQHQ